MHRHDRSTEVLTQAVVRYAVERMRMDPPPLDKTATGRRAAGDGRPDRHRHGHRRPRGAAHLRRRARPGEHLDRPSAVLVVRARGTDRGGNPVRPGRRAHRASTAARGSRVAERSSPRTRRCGTSPTSSGCPTTAGGVFVTGGTAGNLSALIAARFRWRHRADGVHDRTRGLLLTGKGAHSSVGSAARAMDADVHARAGR